MRKLIWAGAGLGLLVSGGVVLAQPAPDGGRPEMEYHGMGMGRHGPGEMMGYRRGGPGMGGAAAFRLRRGDAEIDVRCSVHESTKDCVEAAVMLIDKAAGPKPQ